MCQGIRRMRRSKREEQMYDQQKRRCNSQRKKTVLFLKFGKKNLIQK